MLHDLVPTLAAPTVALSGADGQVRPIGAQGVFHADCRVISAAVLTVDGREPRPIGHALIGAGVTRFVSLVPGPGGEAAVRINRTRRVRPGAVEEEIEVVSTAPVPVRATVAVAIESDLAPIEAARSGRTDRRVWDRPGVAVHITDDSADHPSGTSRPGGDPARSEGDAGGPRPDGTPAWPVSLAPGSSVVLHWSATVDDPAAVVRAGTGGSWSRPVVRALDGGDERGGEGPQRRSDPRLARLVDRSLDDLAALRLTTPLDGEDTFLGAGVPWFLTLFGRDSLWAARMMLPLGTELAMGTLRVLARRQGARLDPATGEAPGKIMHELRRSDVPVPGRLPAAYYGTIDATLLWISLLHDAWRWGHDPAEVAALLPALSAALAWLSTHADPDGDGFLEYLDATGRGLANQGWKDSGDAIRRHDGRRATPPIALAEVQAYAYRAALDAAALLAAFDLPGAARWRSYATDISGFFRERFWLPHGRFPALALDGSKQPVDSLTSNIGHLLGTGLLTADEESRIAAALASTAMSGGYGLRTMSSDDRGFAPLSYHCGSIWPHDTAIVAAGLARAGFATEALTLIDGLLTAAEAFDFRLPELYSGDARTDVARPRPYPTACHPQAWSAAAAILILQSWLGLSPDVPRGVVRLTPLPGAPQVSGLTIAGQEVAFDGRTLTGLRPGLRIERPRLR